MLVVSLNPREISLFSMFVCVYFRSVFIFFVFWGEGFALTCLFGWIHWRDAFHIVLSLVLGRPQLKVQVTTTPTLWGILYVVCSALQSWQIPATYYKSVLYKVHLYCFSPKLKNVRFNQEDSIPLQRPPLLLLFFSLMIKTSAGCNYRETWPFSSSAGPRPTTCNRRD